MNTLTINRRELLNFMNDGGTDAQGHHSALAAFLGEPLAVGLLLHYLGSQARCISTKVTTGQQTGPRLDAWIAHDHGVLYQTEIKMWAGNAIGGLRLKSDADAETQLAGGQRQWARLWDSETQLLKADTVRKVLTPMKVPRGHENDIVQPLLCVWWAVKPTEEPGPWFHLPLTPTDGQPFNRLNIFSLTQYLMTLPDDTIYLQMPLALQRLEWLGKLLSPPNQHWTASFHARQRIYGDGEYRITPPESSQD